MLIRTENGFTLMEVLVALAILTFVFLVFVSSFSNQFSNILMIEEKGKTLYTIQEDVEQLLLDIDYWEEIDWARVELSPIEDFKIIFLDRKGQPIEVTSQARLVEMEMDYEYAKDKLRTLSIKTWLVQPNAGDSL